jgi:hypothetical protein
VYVVTRRYTLAGSSGELLRRIKEEFVPIVTSLPGFKAYHIVDCGGLAAMSIGFWGGQGCGHEIDRGSTRLDIEIGRGLTALSAG